MHEILMAAFIASNVRIRIGEFGFAYPRICIHKCMNSNALNLIYLFTQLIIIKTSMIVYIFFSKKINLQCFSDIYGY